MFASAAVPHVNRVGPLTITIEHYWFMLVDDNKWLWQCRYKTNDGPMTTEHGESSEPRIALPNLSIWIDSNGLHHILVEAECDRLRVGHMEL